jgi:5-methylcytosine-specific restriction protein A
MERLLSQHLESKPRAAFREARSARDAWRALARDGAAAAVGAHFAESAMVRCTRLWVVDSSPDCPLCRRAVRRLTRHHLRPVTRGGAGGEIVRICADCHDALHEMFTNKELEQRYSSLPALLGDERFARHVRWLSKQDPRKRFPARRARDQRRRGRNA